MLLLLFFQLKQSVSFGKTFVILVAPVIIFGESFVFDFCFDSVFLKDFCEYILVGWEKRFLASVELIVFCPSVFYKEFLFYFRCFFVRNVIKNIFCSPGKFYFLVCLEIRTFLFFLWKKQRIQNIDANIIFCYLPVAKLPKTVFRVFAG